MSRRPQNLYLEDIAIIIRADFIDIARLGQMTN